MPGPRPESLTSMLPITLVPFIKYTLPSPGLVKYIKLLEGLWAIPPTPTVPNLILVINVVPFIIEIELEAG
jgi:hypothetical protein